METCCFDCLTAYSKVWLQFVFPLYIWSSAVLIIVLSRYSDRVAQVMGNNSVPVWATLFLLSYANILRICSSNQLLLFLQLLTEVRSSRHLYGNNLHLYCLLSSSCNVTCSILSCSCVSLCEVYIHTLYRAFSVILILGQYM